MSPIGIDAQVAAEMFDMLYRYCAGLVELRAPKTGARPCFAALGDPAISRYLTQHAATDVYMGVATRRDATSGALANCQHLPALFVDVDYKATPEADARARLERCPVKPSLIVASGGGLHCYWFLREPMELPAEAERAKSLLRRLGMYLGGDLVAAEPARILRVPGTWNAKYDPPRFVRLERRRPALRYNPADFEGWLPPESTDAELRPFAIPERVPEGERNTTCFRAARSLFAKGFSKAEVTATLTVTNQTKCEPPLLEDELARVIANAAQLPHDATWRAGAPSAPPSAATDPGITDGAPGSSLPEPASGPTLARGAFYGLAGRIVECIEPGSEADPAAILLHVLIGAGNLIGRSVYATVEKTRHHCNEFAVLVGDSAKGRKGQAWSTPQALLRAVNPEWMATRVRPGLSSGEGVIYHVRDPREEQQPVKERGRVVDYQTVIADPGEPDKRLLVFEPELASVLRRMNGETNSLSAVIRQAWDSGDLSTLTRRESMRATGAHISIIAHVTREELLANLTETEKANGFANRFLFALVRRSKYLPDGGGVPDAALAPLIGELGRVASYAATAPRELPRTPEAAEMFRAVYESLSTAKPGLLGAVLARAEAHVLRLSLLYAALDCATAVEPAHLEAALALWDYADASARLIFGGRTGMADYDTLLAALRARGPLSQTEISGLFHRNKSAAQLEALLRLAEDGGRIRKATPLAGERGGRPITRWEAAP